MYTGMLKPLIFDHNEQEYHTTLYFWGNPCLGIAWTLYNLATHPEHQEKCRQEVDAIFSEKDEDDKDITRYSLHCSDAQ
jgi:hypothetical protein